MGSCAGAIGGVKFAGAGRAASCRGEGAGPLLCRVWFADRSVSCRLKVPDQVRDDEEFSRRIVGGIICRGRPIGRRRFVLGRGGGFSGLGSFVRFRL